MTGQPTPPKKCILLRNKGLIKGNQWLISFGTVIFGVQIGSEVSERFAESSEDLFIDTSFWKLAEVVSTWDEYVIHIYLFNFGGHPRKVIDIGA